MDYSSLKSIHIACVILSGAGFLLRAAISLHSPSHPLLRGRARIVPHLVDSALLASALAMAWSLGLQVLSLPWLQTKLVLLPCYVVLGSRALSPRRGPTDRRVSLLLAVATFAGIVASAVTKHPLGLGVEFS